MTAQTRCCLPLRGNSGFTLVELLVVVAILAILTVLLLPSARGIIEHSRTVTCQSNLHSISHAIHVDPAGLPAASVWLDTAIANGAGTVLKCPNGEFEFVGPGTGGGGDPGGGGGDIPLSVTVSGAVEMIEPPAASAFRSVTSSTKIFMFPEKQNYTLANDMAVAFTSDFNSWMSGVQADKIVPAGTKVSSYCLYYNDPYYPWAPHYAGKPATVTVVGGKIAGIIAGDYVASALYASDPIVGAPGTNYDWYGAWISINGDDALELSENGTKLEHLSVGTWGPYMDGWRILLEDTPDSGGDPGEEPPPQIWVASYGMNDQVPVGPAGRLRQLAILDYDRSIVDPDGDHQDVLNDFVDEERIRHLGRMNGLMVDGSVELFTPEQLHRDAELWLP